MQPEGSVVFIVNPIAGTRQKDFILENIRHYLPKEVTTEIIFTEYPGHAFDHCYRKSERRNKNYYCGWR